MMAYLADEQYVAVAISGGSYSSGLLRSGYLRWMIFRLQ
jgi:hypothetical protein